MKLLFPCMAGAKEAKKGNIKTSSLKTFKKAKQPMILFFGTRPGKTEIKHLKGVCCPYCEQVGTLTASKTTNWFHLFWIKIFKISSHLIAECSHCKRVYFETEFSEGMRRKIEEK